ncbi:MAG: ankyrin repeat domain-containing protein [Bryobacteraceae bacterium]
MTRVVWCLFVTLGFVSTQPIDPLRAASNQSPLVDAAKADDLSAVRKLIQEKADANAPASDGSTALLWATYHSNVAMTQDLLAARAAVDVANRYGVTPLLQASRNGDVPVMQALLTAGADPTRWHPEGETPLMAAARTGNTEAVLLLLSRGAFVNAVDPFQEQTALMWASAQGHLDVVKALLKAGADPNLKAHVTQITNRKNADHPSGGFTALMFATRNGHSDVVKALIAGGADPKLTNADGATATIIAIVNDRLDLAKQLLDLGADPNDGALFFAVDMHDATTDMRAHDGSRLQPNHENSVTALTLVKSLLDLGANVNKPFVGALHSTTLCCASAVRSSPFYRAASAADVEVLKLMLAHGAKIDWTPNDIPADDQGKGKAAAKGKGAPPATAVTVAMKGGKGASFAAGPGFGRLGPPPFREPGSRDPSEAMKLLLDAGADANTEVAGTPLLHQAVQAGQISMIRALVKAGAALDAGNREKQTALAVAEKIRTSPPVGPNPQDPDAYIPPKDSPEKVVAVLRELMHLGPNDPIPAARGVTAAAADDSKGKSNPAAAGAASKQ